MYNAYLSADTVRKSDCAIWALDLISASLMLDIAFQGRLKGQCQLYSFRQTCGVPPSQQPTEGLSQRQNNNSTSIKQSSPPHKAIQIRSEATPQFHFPLSTFHIKNQERSDSAIFHFPFSIFHLKAAAPLSPFHILKGVYF